MELNKLCELCGAPGDEGAVRNAILAAASKVCDDVRIDKAGNVIAFKKGVKTSRVSLPERVNSYPETDQAVLASKPNEMVPL